MDQDRFDEIAIAAAAGPSRRTVLRRVLGGSLAALLGIVGLGIGDDEAAAQSRCAKKCNNKNSNKKRRTCRKKCQRQEGDPFSQQGGATLALLSEPDCAAAEGECVDAVQGTVTGTPIAQGTFEGQLTGTNFRPGTESDTTDIDYAGTITATETSTGDTLLVAIDVTLTRNDATGDFTYEGTFEISGGTGRFTDATGSGTTTGSGTRPGAGGTVEAFTMTGTINLA
jgi:hypothetical protein